MGKEHTTLVLDMINDERQRQNEKWGDQSGNHPFEWMSILMEEVGELAEAINETCFSTEHVKSEKGGAAAILREAIQVAAVAAAIAEATLIQDIPSGCSECKFHLLNDIFRAPTCRAVEGYGEWGRPINHPIRIITSCERPKWCPLVEV